MSVNVVSNNVIELEGSDYGFLEDVTIDEEVQEHYKIIGKEIVGTFSNILVTGDKKANRLWFTMRDTYDGEELHNKSIKIWFNTPDGYLDYDEPSEIYHSSEAQQIRFSWLLTGKHSRIPGTIKFSVEITDDSGYEWNTLEAEFVVVRTINKNGDTVPPFERGWVIKCNEKSEKALKIANMPSDYNQNDESKPDHILNRPFYEYKDYLCNKSYTEEEVVASNGYLELGDIAPTMDKEYNYKIAIGNPTTTDAPIAGTYEGRSEFSDMGDGSFLCDIDVGYDGMWCVVLIYNREAYPNKLILDCTELIAHGCSISIEFWGDGIKQLEDKFIPNAIARSRWTENYVNANKLACEEKVCIGKSYRKKSYPGTNPAIVANEDVTLVEGERLLFEIIEDGKVTYDEIASLGEIGEYGNGEFVSGRFYSWSDGSKSLTIQTWDGAYEISVKMFRPTGKVKQIDEKFIPNTIARKADMKSIFALCAISSKVANITVGMSVSGIFPLKFDSWSVSIREKVIASALGPTDEFVTAPVIFQNEGVMVTFYVGTLLIVTELEIINQHGNTAWGILKFIKFAEEE